VGKTLQYVPVRIICRRIWINLSQFSVATSSRVSCDENNFLNVRSTKIQLYQRRHHHLPKITENSLDVNKRGVAKTNSNFQIVDLGELPTPPCLCSLLFPSKFELPTGCPRLASYTKDSSCASHAKWENEVLLNP
jgi:hypothetical protein